MVWIQLAQDKVRCRAVVNIWVSRFHKTWGFLHQLSNYQLLKKVLTTYNHLTTFSLVASNKIINKIELAGILHTNSFWEVKKECRASGHYSIREFCDSV